MERFPQVGPARKVRRPLDPELEGFSSKKHAASSATEDCFCRAALPFQAAAQPLQSRADTGLEQTMHGANFLGGAGLLAKPAAAVDIRATTTSTSQVLFCQ